MNGGQGKGTIRDSDGLQRATRGSFKMEDLLRLEQVIAVADGDTFTMQTDSETVRIRIGGMDSPERGSSGYGAAAGVLANMIEGKLVHCLQDGLGTPCDGRSRLRNEDRIVAQCSLARRTSVLRWYGAVPRATGRSSPAAIMRSLRPLTDPAPLVPYQPEPPGP